MNEDHRELREQLGLHALGLTDRAQRTRLQAHLDGCPDCRSELASITPLRALLERVQPDRLDDRPRPPAELAERVMAAVRRERTGARRRRPLRAGFLLAAVVTLVALGGLGGWALRPVPPEPPTTVAQLETVADRGVQASAELIDHTWGLEVVLDARGFTEGERYQVQVVERDGDVSTAGAFVGTGRAEMVCRLNSAVLMADAVAFEVVEADGDRVIRGTWG